MTLQISRDELRRIINVACDRADVLQPDRKMMLNEVESARGTCFGSFQKKFPCPIMTLVPDERAAKAAISSDSRLLTFVEEFDSLMYERFKLGEGLTSYNVEIT